MEGAVGLDIDQSFVYFPVADDLVNKMGSLHVRLLQFIRNCIRYKGSMLRGDDLVSRVHKEVVRHLLCRNYISELCKCIVVLSTISSLQRVLN